MSLSERWGMFPEKEFSRMNKRETLRALRESERPLCLTELMRWTGINQETLLKILAQLIDCGDVVKQGRDEYRRELYTTKGVENAGTIPQEG